MDIYMIYAKRFLEYKKYDNEFRLTELDFVNNEFYNLDYYKQFKDEEESIRKMVLRGFDDLVTSMEVCNLYGEFLTFKREVLMIDLKRVMEDGKYNFKVIELEYELDKLKELDKFEFLEYDKDVFKNYDAFRVFLEFIKTVTVPYIDFSFIFQQMKKDKLIYPLKHKDFIDWLGKNKIITGKVFENFFEIGELRSLNKSTDGKRLNTYLNLKERFKLE